MLELLIVIVIAAIGMLVIGRAFASTSTGTERTQMKAAQAAKKEKQQQQQPKQKQQASAKSPKSSPKASKKQAAAKAAERAAEEAEMDRLINQTGKSVSGMVTDKAKVISLASVQKQDTVSSTKKEKVDISTKQRLIEAEEGFAIVEKKDKSPSPKFRKEKAKKKDEQAQDKNLNSFFKAQDAKGRASKGMKPSYKGDDDKESESKPAGTVTMRKKITSEAKDTWASNYSE